MKRFVKSTAAFKTFAAIACTGLLIQASSSFAQTTATQQSSQNKPSPVVDINQFLNVIGEQWAAFGSTLPEDIICYQTITDRRRWGIAFKTFNGPVHGVITCEGWFCGLPEISRDGSTFYFKASNSTADGSGEILIIELARNGAPRVATRLPAQSGYYSISPDRSEITYQLKTGQIHHLFRKALHSKSDPVQITEKDTGGLLPSYSPDGRQIAFVANRKLRIYSLETGQNRILVDDVWLKELPDWSPDAKWIAYQGTIDGGQNYDVFKVNVESRDVLRLTDSPGIDADPIFSKNGERIMFVSDGGKGRGNPTIFTMKSDGSDVFKDPTANPIIYLPAAVTDFPDIPQTEKAVAQQDEDEKEALTTSSTETPSEVVAVDDSSQTTPVSDPGTIEELLELLKSKQAQFDSVLDGQHVIYLRRDGAVYQLEGKIFGQSETVELLRLVNPARHDVSSDRTKLYLRFHDEGARSLHIVKIERGQPASIFATVPADPELMFVRFDVAESGTEFIFDVLVDETSQVFRYWVETQKLELVSGENSGGIFPAYSPDDGEVAYVTAGNLLLKDLASGDQEALVSGESALQYPTWTPDGAAVIYQASSRDSWGFDLFKVDLATRNVTRLTHAEDNDVHPRVTPEGQTILFASESETAPGQPTLFRMDLEGGAAQRDPAAPKPLLFPQ